MTLDHETLATILRIQHCRLTALAAARFARAILAAATPALAANWLAAAASYTIEQPTDTVFGGYDAAGNHVDARLP